MNFLVQNNYFQYGLLVIGGIVGFGALTEVILYTYSHFKNKKLDDSQNIYEVFWTNNLSQSCNCNVRKSSPENCKNNFCYVRTLHRIISLINGAQHSIDLAMYIFTSNELTGAIKKARERGVRVRIIVDKNMVHSTNSKIIELDANDIPVRYHPTSTYLMHHKFCVFDGPGRVKAIGRKSKNLEPFLLSGSTNWTNDGFSTNWENILITTNKKLVSEFENEFQRIWNDFEKIK